MPLAPEQTGFDRAVKGRDALGALEGTAQIKDLEAVQLKGLLCLIPGNHVFNLKVIGFKIFRKAASLGGDGGDDRFGGDCAALILADFDRVVQRVDDLLVQRVIISAAFAVVAKLKAKILDILHIVLNKGLVQRHLIIIKRSCIAAPVHQGGLIHVQPLVGGVAVVKIRDRAIDLGGVHTVGGIRRAQLLKVGVVFGGVAVAPKRADIAPPAL